MVVISSFMVKVLLSDFNKIFLSDLILLNKGSYVISLSHVEVDIFLDSYYSESSLVNKDFN